MKVGGAPAGTAVKVDWFDANDQKVAEDQKAVGKKALSPWTFVNPVRYWRLNMAVPASFSFGDGTGKVSAGKFGLAPQGSPLPAASGAP